MNQIYKQFEKTKLKRKDINNLYILIMIISGIFGFLYEEIFYFIDLGYFTKRGSSYGPWIPIYAIGGLLITIITYRYKNKPIIIFLLSTVITGVLEYMTGYVLLECFHTRLWDYNIEILNYGNINGFICLRSVLFFGLSSLFLIYIIIPSLIKLIKKGNQIVLNKICITVFFLFLLDIIIYLIINHI